MTGYIVAIIASLIIGAGIIYFLNLILEKKGLSSAKENAKKIVEDAQKEAQVLHKEKMVEAKDELLKLRSKFDRENEERRRELNQREKRIQQKEETLDKKLENQDRKEKGLVQKEQEIAEIKEQTLKLKEERRLELEKVAQMSADEAKKLLLQELEKELDKDYAIKIKQAENNFKSDAARKSQEIIALAIQKSAVDQVVEATISVVSLPSDEMKGRIIGREGRNIRTLETTTGVDLIIDDTPEAVILSSFDPIRREIARVALEKLISDGRIHPARIEEMVEKARKEVEERILREGEEAMFQVGLSGFNIEIIKLLGKLRFRTSYGQNVLQHSIEVAYLAGGIAGELGMNTTLAKRAGLLHDIGKALDFEVEGPHALLGARFAEKAGESFDIIHAIEAHHEDVEFKTLIAVLVQACDAISAARPGARRESLESYLKRLEKLEKVANSFEGVEKSFAIQAGREIRIMVKPKTIDDNAAVVLSRDIVKKIEEELEYPGQIKVTVIREVRAVEYAK